MPGALGPTGTVSFWGIDSRIRSLRRQRNRHVAEDSIRDHGGHRSLRNLVFLPNAERREHRSVLAQLDLIDVADVHAGEQNGLALLESRRPGKLRVERRSPSRVLRVRARVIRGSQ